MSSYSTRQRKALLAYLSRHPDELLSARQIADALADEKISLSAVYRNLAQLEAEEKVRRSSKSGTREVYYQYLDAESCKGALPTRFSMAPARIAGKNNIWKEDRL